MNVEIFASTVSDNFFYAVESDGRVALVDPVDGSQAVDWVREHGYELRYLINTHHHRDHTGGDRTVLNTFHAVELVAGEEDADEIDAQLSGGSVDRTVTDGDVLELGEVTLEVLDTPGHTPGHVSFVVGDYLFSGDTIFVAGAGNCNFGGHPGTLFRTFRDTLSQLDDDLTFLPGHDYAVRDLEFVLSLEPDNERARDLLERARETGDDELFRTTLGTERSYSPFFRYDDPQLASRLEEAHPAVFEQAEERARSREEAVFRTVRSLRDDW
ncbi:MAG: MBL fold metallo-hydrolase [Bradymonadaceae bacterium]